MDPLTLHGIPCEILYGNTTVSMVIPWSLLPGIPWSLHGKFHMFSHGIPCGFPHGIPLGYKTGTAML